MSAAAVDNAKGKDAAAVKTDVDGLTGAEKAVLKAALEADAGDTGVATNVKDIAENGASLHALHLTIMTNKQGIYEARSMIEENRTNTMQNYQACFVGNRQMANENTEAIFKNRTAILDALKVTGPVQKNFRNTKYNEAKIQYLENRSLLNNRVAKVNEKMSEANADLIAINDQILASNDEITKFNAAQILTNSNLLDGIKAEKATPEANATRIASNKTKIANLKEKNDKYNAVMVEKHKGIKANRKAIEANAALIKERRKEILANREAIKANGLKVTELIRAGVANVEEVTGKMADLSDDEKTNIRTALSGGGEDATVIKNRKNVSENGARLHELHVDVMSNKGKLYAIRAIIEENRALILTNYASAFIGTRQEANQNTDMIFKNRCAILDALKLDGQIQENFRNSKYNEATADFLEFRSLLNNRVAKVNKMMKAANTKLIDINSSIMTSNGEIVSENAKLIDTNSKLLVGIKEDKATPEANAARIDVNAKRIQVIADRNAKYETSVEAMLKAAMDNRAKVKDNAKLIASKGEEVRKNRADMIENGKKIAALLRA